MKTKNKEQKKAIAADILERYPKAKKVAVTSDGMAFITDENEIAVKNHAVKNRYGKELSIARFTRDELEEEAKASKRNKTTTSKDDEGKTAKELIAEIEAAKEVKVVEAILKAENNGEKRKTVLEAAEKQIQELKALKDNGSEGDDAKTAKELIAVIEAAKELQAVEAILKAENEGEKRKTVLEAAEKRINELKEAK